MMLLLTANTVVMMAIAIGLWCFAVLPIVFVAHLVLALGIMPLILATMAYFVPILTRSDNASRSIDGLAMLAWLGGVAIVASVTVQMEAISVAFAIIGTLLSAKAAASLLLWIILRTRSNLGALNPGLACYGAALSILLAGLFVVPLLWLWPEHRALLRQVHLYANLIGFVGLSAIGTMIILLLSHGADHPG